MKQQHTTQELESYISVIQAELESRKSATPTSAPDVYERAGVSEGNEELFDEVVYAICEDNMSITEVSTPDRAGFLTGNAKNWVANLGGLREFKAMHRAPDATEVSFVDYIPTHNVESVDVPVMVSTYFAERGKTPSAFRTEVTLVQAGTYKTIPFGVVAKPNGVRYVVGKLKGDKVQAFKQGNPMYVEVDKATKGHRARMQILVFDPTG